MEPYNVFIILIILLIVVILYYSLKNTNSKLELFNNYGMKNLQGNNSKNPKTKYLLLTDSFPTTSDPNKTTNNQYSNIWWRYPALKINSYKQITNNIRYSNNPDNGRIAPAEFAGGFYKDYQQQSNYSKLLPLAPINNRRRVNYYLTK